MKKSFFNLLLITVCCFKFSYSQSPAEVKLHWFTNLADAHKLSQETKKPIFAFFTGSDWCVWCKKLHNDVLSKAEFIEWAQKNVILLELDFPRAKQLPPEIVQQNNGLQQALKVAGYPTVWLLYTSIDSANNSFKLTPVGSLGYPQGAEPGKEQVKFLEDADKILAFTKNK